MNSWSVASNGKKITFNRNANVSITGNDIDYFYAFFNWIKTQSEYIDGNFYNKIIDKDDDYLYVFELKFSLKTYKVSSRRNDLNQSFIYNWNKFLKLNAFS